MKEAAGPFLLGVCVASERVAASSVQITEITKEA